MSDVERWLDHRGAGVPGTLKRLVREAVDGVAADADLVSTLRLAADGLIAQVMKDPSRGGALDLLAADALMTYVCEVVSEQHPSDLTRLS